MAPDEPIRLVRPDPDWPAQFERERRALEMAIGKWAEGGIHHVGSTAVPGLEAKPILDMPTAPITCISFRSAPGATAMSWPSATGSAPIHSSRPTMQP